MTDDAALLRGFAAKGKEADFAELVRRHLGLVYHAARRRMGGRGDVAEDVAQEVFAVLARDAARLAQHPALEGWLYETTRRIAARHRRREQNAQQREAAFGEMNATEEETVDWGQVEPLLDEAMDGLDASAREAVLLRYFQNRAFGEIGDALGVSEDAARMRVNRALERLRSALAKRGIHSTATALGGVLVTQAAGAAPTSLATAVVGQALGASAGGALAWGAAILMTKTQTISLLALGVAALGVGTAVVQTKALSRAESELAAVRDEWAMERAHREALENEQATVARPRAEANSAAPPSVMAGSGPTETPSEARSMMQLNGDLLGQSPAFLELGNRRMQLEFEIDTYALFQEMEISPAEQAELLQLMDRFNRAAMDVVAAAYSQGVDATSPQIGTMITKEVASIQREIAELLGPERNQQRMAFDARRNGRRLVGQLAAQLAANRMPLGVDQGERLVDLLSPVSENPNAALQPPVSAEEWDAFMAGAEAVLSPDQQRMLALFAELQQVDHQRMLVAGGDGGQ